MQIAMEFTEVYLWCGFKGDFPFRLAVSDFRLIL